VRRHWRLLRTGFDRPAFNLACDDALLRSKDPAPVLRLYGWRPAALSLGYFQPLEPFLEPAQRAGVEVVRRPTGGGAIHHDDELTFSLIASPGLDGYPAGIVEAYELVHRLLVEGFAGLGAELRFRGGATRLSVRPRDASLCFEDTTSIDLVDASGRKVVGSAQRRVDGRVLHHGSIPLSVPSLTPTAGALGPVAGRELTWDEAADTVQEVFSRGLCGGQVEPSALSADEKRSADSLMTGRYADPGR